MNKDFEFLRAELWKDIAVAYTTASNCTSAISAANWADRVLKDFDLRFEGRLAKDDAKEASV